MVSKDPPFTYTKICAARGLDHAYTCATFVPISLEH